MEGSNLERSITIRLDEGKLEYVLNLSIPGVRDFEVSSSVLSDAVGLLAQELEDEGI